jgi:hypothetical protein
MSLWFNKFKGYETALHDDPEKHGGRPRASQTEEICVIVEGLIREIEESKFVKRIVENCRAILHSL